MIQRYGKRHGIPGDELHPHAFRHRFGTELAEGDVSLVNIQDLMGHSDPKSTAVYMHLAQRRKAGIVDSTDRWPRCARRCPTCSSACLQADHHHRSRATHARTHNTGTQTLYRHHGTTPEPTPRRDLAAFRKSVTGTA
jgi:hypothetical protein